MTAPPSIAVVDASVKPVGAVTAALSILRCLGRAPDSMRLSEIVRAEAINASTALNILRTLEFEGLVSFDRKAKRYALADGLLDLAQPLADSKDTGARLARAMVAAAQDLRATVGLWRVVGREVELLQVADTNDVMRIAFTVGRRLPMFLGAMGRLVAARGDWSAQALADGFAAVPWALPPTYERWLADLAEARETGAAVDAGHVNAGIFGVAVPVEHDGPLGRVVAAAILVTGPRPDPGPIIERLRTVAAAAA